MIRKHKKIRMFLAIVVSSFLPMVSAYICSSTLTESDLLSPSLSLENPERDSLFVARHSKDSSFFLPQIPSFDPRVTVLRC